MNNLTSSASSSLLIIVGMILVAPALSAQAPPQQPTDFDAVLFPPELIMQHRRAIELTDDQRDDITDLIENAQRRLTRLQWELLEGMQSLTETLERSRIDLDRAIDQLGSTLELEKRIKESHLEMLIRIKNLLTADQQAELGRLREAGSGPPDEA